MAPKSCCSRRRSPTTRRFIASLVIALIICAFPAPAAPQTRPSTAPAAHELVRTDEFAIAIPSGWRDMKMLSPQLKLFRGGDGRGVPLTDETGAPLQIGVTIEKFRDPKSIEEGAAELIKAAKSAKQLEVIGEPKLEKLRLADGSEAALLVIEFIKEGRRHSLQMKLLAKRGKDDAWVVSGFLVGGKESTWPTADSKLATWLRGHLTTFVFDPAKLDASTVPGPFEPQASKP